MGAESAQVIWKTALAELQLQVSRSNYDKWLGKTVGLSFQDNQFVVSVPNTFVAEYLDKNQRSLIEKTLTGITLHDIEVLFSVNGRHQNLPGSSGARDETTTIRQISFNGLNPKYTFDSFVVGNCNRLTSAVALEVAQNPGHNYNPLFIFGGVGSGKTHLLHAIGHVALASNIQVLYVSVEQFTNEFVTAIRERKTEEFLNKYRSVDLLLIDDIHFIGGKEQIEESFFHTLNELQNANHQIIITSNCPSKAMSLLQSSLHSRFERGFTVDIQPPDFETRLAILRAKAKQQGVEIPLDTLEFICHQVQQNVRKLEGSLNRVTAYARLIKTLPTPEIAARALEDIAIKQPKITFIVNADERITLINEEGCETLRYKEEELIGKNWFDTLVPEEERNKRRRDFHRVWAGDIEPVEYQENPLLIKDGQKRLIAFQNAVIRDSNGQIVGVLLSGEDITELRKAQKQLQHTQLLASLGQMTADIAHEVNNPLGSVLLYSELLMASDVASQTKKDLKIIHDEAKRAAKIMTDLLIYGRRAKSQMQRLNLHRILKQVLGMRRYGEKMQNITVSTNLSDGPLYIKGDSSRLMQVFMNLMLNAEEALREAKGGHITVTTQIDGDWAKVSIADDGTGIPEENLYQVFYPFFTTKPAGEGTGFGLSICYGIVTSHNGLIHAENNEMGGATFTVELPLAKSSRRKKLTAETKMVESVIT